MKDKTKEKIVYAYQIWHNLFPHAFRLLIIVCMVGVALIIKDIVLPITTGEYVLENPWTLSQCEGYIMLFMMIFILLYLGKSAKEVGKK